MSQIKYLINACLILVISLISYSVLHTIYSVPIIEMKSEAEWYCGTTDLSITNHSTSTSNSEGKRLFQQNCQTCHALDKNLTGPALRGFTDRGPWSKKENIHKWINNPAAFMAKDAYARGLKQQYGVVMPAFPQLTTQQIDAIIDYITEVPALAVSYEIIVN